LWFATEKRCSLRLVTGKWLLKNYILTTRLQYKTWANAQIKNHTKSRELRLIRPQSGQRNPEHVYLTLRLLMSYIYGAPILDVSTSHTTTHHSR